MQKKLSLQGVTKIVINEKIEKSGVPVGYDSKEKSLYIDDNPFHSLIIGSTGSGKTQSITIPMVKMMINAEESFVLVDSLGEVYKEVSGALNSRGYETIVLNFKDNLYGNHWNPFTIVSELYNKGKIERADEFLSQLAQNLMVSSSLSTDPFWENSAADYFMGLVYLLLEENASVTLDSILDLSHAGNEMIDGTNYFKKYYETRKNKTSYVYLSTIINAPTETRGSILSVFEQKMKVLVTNLNLMEMVSTTDFDIESLNKKKTAVFIILPENLKSTKLVSTFVRQIFDATSKCDKPTHFILDDFYTLGAISNFDKVLESARRKNIYFTIMISSLDDLYMPYGKPLGNRIKESFGLILYLLSNNIDTINEICALCSTIKKGEKEIPFITERELKTLNYWEGILIRIRQLPSRVLLLPDYKIEWNLEKNAIELEKHPIHHYEKFNFQKLVSED